MHTKPGQKEPTVLVKFVSAGLAASVAEAATIPIDTAKVRLQVSTFILYLLFPGVRKGFDFKTTLRERAPLVIDHSLIAQSAPLYFRSAIETS